MKKVKATALTTVGVFGLSNTAAVVISDIDESDETVSYYLSTVGTDYMVKVHKAKIYYRVSDNEPYFNSIFGRMLLSNFININGGY